MRVAVVIACFNGAATIGRQLEALTRQHAPYDWEILVADNGSTDASRSVIHTYAERDGRIRLIDASARQGLSYARNAGADAARGEAVAFCDQDDEVADGWLAAIGSAVERDGFVAARLEHDMLNEPWTIAVRGRPQGKRLLQLDGAEDTPYAFGCTLAVRKELHARIGGFDEAFTKGCEDADYCLRMQAGGEKLVFVPEAVVHYRFRADFRGIYRQARDYGESEVLLHHKHRALLHRAGHRMREAARIWLVTLKKLLGIHDRASAGLALWWLGQRAGRLRGSFKYRTFLP
jgi:GT2 family glycosyltransferase